MRVLLLFAVTVLSLSPAAVSGAEKKKLQIGIKKRVDNCPIKSRKGDVLNMHYTGKLEDGTEFDSSIPRDRPFTFTLGTGQVIKGWDQGLLGMCEGEKRKLVIPAELGYGDRGAPPKIPGGATLIFEVELLSIERRSDLWWRRGGEEGNFQNVSYHRCVPAGLWVKVCCEGIRWNTDWLQNTLHDQCSDKVEKSHLTSRLRLDFIYGLPLLTDSHTLID